MPNWQTDATHAGCVCQWPFRSHVSGMSPLHCIIPGVHGPPLELLEALDELDVLEELDVLLVDALDEEELDVVEPLHADAEQICVPEHALPQVPQFLASEVVSAHHPAQQATGHAITGPQWKVTSHCCTMLPEHCVVPGKQSTHFPFAQTCEPHGVGGLSQKPSMPQTSQALPRQSV
jgi:hypothetical protein